MELKLNIYEKKEIVKTYTATTYDLMWGTMEDFINVIDIDSLSRKKGDEAFIGAASQLISGGIGQLKPLMLDVFEGLTEAELRNTRVTDLTAVVFQIIKYSVAELNGVTKPKNA